MDRSVQRGMLAFGGVAASLLLSPLGLVLGIPTPGLWVGMRVTPHLRDISLGAAMITVFAVDFVFWFAVLCGIYWLVTLLRRRRVS